MLSPSLEDGMVVTAGRGGVPGCGSSRTAAGLRLGVLARLAARGDSLKAKKHAPVSVRVPQDGWRAACVRQRVRPPAASHWGHRSKCRHDANNASDAYASSQVSEGAGADRRLSFRPCTSI